MTTITNTCVCVEMDDNGDEMTDSSGYPVWAKACYGCFEDNLGNLTFNILHPWLNALGLDADETVLLLNGSNMGWLNRYGVIMARATSPAIIRAMSINGEYRIEFLLSDDKREMSARRSSHDEPMGARFTFTAVSEKAADRMEEQGVALID